MALKIRLARGGAKKRPFYRIVVADSRSPRDGRFIEKIGRYNPLLPKDHDERVVVDFAKADAWIKKGATPTDRVARFFSFIHVKEDMPDGADAPELIRVPEGEAGARPLYIWKAGNNPKKGEPGEAAKQRLAEKAEKEEAKKAAEEEAKAAPAEETAES